MEQDEARAVLQPLTTDLGRFAGVTAREQVALRALLAAVERGDVVRVLKVADTLHSAAENLKWWRVDTNDTCAGAYQVRVAESTMRDAASALRTPAESGGVSGAVEAPSETGEGGK